jgi:spermidine synthase
VIYTNVIKLVKQGSHGSAKIVHDSPSQFERMIGAIHGQPLTRPNYCRLLINGSVMMTDAEFERRTNIAPVCQARGDALIAGLGIGLILAPFIKRCSSVTVIEKNQDVITLVAPSFPSVAVIHADIFAWTPDKGRKFDVIYFDIWAGVCPDDLEQDKRLRKRFQEFLAKGGYMESWTRIANRHFR